MDRGYAEEVTENSRNDDEAVRAVAAALVRIMSEGSLNDAIVVDAGEYYAQFTVEGYDMGALQVHGEVSGNANIESKYHLGVSQIAALEENGWLLDETKGGGNYCKEWVCGMNGVTERTIAQETVDILHDVYGVCYRGAPRIQFIGQ